MLGNGNGTFQPNTDFQTGLNSYYVAVGDFNKDGKQDLAVANWGDGTVSVLLGNGDGTFQPQVQYVTGNTPSSVAVGDFNEDGNLDLAVTDANGVAVSILLGRGDGSFLNPSKYPTEFAGLSVVVGDFDHDGKQDLAIAASNLDILLGNGDGTFQPYVSYPTPAEAGSVALGDFNRDGNQDLAVTSSGNNSYLVNFFLGSGDGTFQAPENYAVNYSPYCVAVGDFNRDKSADIVTSNANGTLSVLLNEAGTYVRVASLPNPSQQGQPVTFAAKVTAAVNGSGLPTGSVTFASGSKMANIAIISNGIAKFTTSKIPAGTHKVTARYSGDTNFNPNQSAPITQVVNP